MNIKSLLIGSAAALVAVSGARAADAVVAEPEAVEYVRVCDAYGAGYFYIPGTETCLKIGGYVRYDIGMGDLFAEQSAGTVENPSGKDTYFKRARLSLQLSTASETELGTLKTFAEVRYNWDNDSYSNAIALPFEEGYENSSSFSLNFAYIELGGLRIGKDESFFTTFTDYAGNVINDDIAGGYGPFDTNLISYSYSNNGFSFGISLEEGDDNYLVVDPFNPLNNGYVGWGIDDYMPHVVAGVGYAAGAFQIRGVVGYDTRDDYTSLLTGLPVEVGGWSAKLRGDVEFNEQVSAFAMLLYGENTSAYTSWANGPAGDETLSIIGGATFKASDKLALNTQVQWIDGSSGSDDIFSVVANAAYTVVPGLKVTPEVVYLDEGDDDAFGGYLRFQRSF
jgi:Porin subfamily